MTFREVLSEHDLSPLDWRFIQTHLVSVLERSGNTYGEDKLVHVSFDDLYDFVNVMNHWLILTEGWDGETGES